MDNNSSSNIAMNEVIGFVIGAVKSDRTPQEELLAKVTMHPNWTTLTAEQRAHFIAVICRQETVFDAIRSVALNFMKTVRRLSDKTSEQARNTLAAALMHTHEDPVRVLRMIVVMMVCVSPWVGPLVGRLIALGQQSTIRALVYLQEALWLFVANVKARNLVTSVDLPVSAAPAPPQPVFGAYTVHGGKISLATKIGGQDYVVVPQSNDSMAAVTIGQGEAQDMPGLIPPVRTESVQAPPQQVNTASPFVVNEMNLTNYKYPEVEAPASQVWLAYEQDGTFHIFGGGARSGPNLLTAKHNTDAMQSRLMENFYVLNSTRTKKSLLPKDLNFSTAEDYTKRPWFDDMRFTFTGDEKHCDLVELDLGDAIWTHLGVKSAKLAPYTARTAAYMYTGVSSNDPKKSYQSVVVVNPRLDLGPFALAYVNNTQPSASGVPLYDNSGRIIAIHKGAVPSAQVNVATALNLLITLTNATVDESDIRDKTFEIQQEFLRKTKKGFDEYASEKYAERYLLEEERQQRSDYFYEFGVEFKGDRLTPGLHAAIRAKKGSGKILAVIGKGQSWADAEEEMEREMDEIYADIQNESTIKAKEPAKVQVKPELSTVAPPQASGAAVSATDSTLLVNPQSLGVTQPDASRQQVECANPRQDVPLKSFVATPTDFQSSRVQARNSVLTQTRQSSSTQSSSNSSQWTEQALHLLANAALSGQPLSVQSKPTTPSQSEPSTIQNSTTMPGPQEVETPNESLSQSNLPTLSKTKARALKDVKLLLKSSPLSTQEQQHLIGLLEQVEKKFKPEVTPETSSQ